MSIKNYVTFLLLVHLAASAYAQKKNTPPPDVNGLFDDLPFDDPAANSVLKDNEDPQQKIRQNIRVIASSNKKKCFVGEPVLLSYRLYSSLQSTSTVAKQPDLFGFNLHEIESDNERPLLKKMNGRSYRVFTLQQYQLIPFREGVLKIGAVSVNNSVSYDDNDKKPHTYSGLVNSNSVDLEVRSLPVKGRPAVFSGAVGKFGIVDSVKYTNAGVGENNSLHIEITGEGNTADLSMPDIQWPEGFEHFPIKEHLDAGKAVFPSTIKKIFDIPFISGKEGQFSIPPLLITYFDASKEMYRSVQSPAIDIRVVKASLIPPPATDPYAVKKPGYFLFYFWIIFTAIVLAVIGWIISLKARRKNRQAAQTVIEPVLAEPEKISTDFTRELESAEGISDAEQYIVEFKKLIITYVREKTGGHGDTEEELLLKIKTAYGEIGNGIESLSDQCNRLLYAPGKLDANARLQMKDTFLHLIEKVNKTQEQTGISK